MSMVLILSLALLPSFASIHAAEKTEAPAAKVEIPSTDSTSLPQASSLQTVGEKAEQDKVLKKIETYDELLAAIRKTRQEAEVRVQQAVEQEKVREAWETGRLIDEHILLREKRAEYAKQVLVRLAKDLGTSKTELYYMVKFSRVYPIFPAPGKLSWAHYRELLSVSDPKERDEIASEAAKNKWSQKETREAVRKAKSKKETGPHEEPAKKLEAVAGAPGVYRIIRAKAGPFAGELALDLGFSNYKRLSDVTSDIGAFEEGGMAEFSGSDQGGEVAIFSAAEAKNMGVRLYYYNAYLYKVLDGDTVTAVVDLGFGFVTSQVLRLRGIDAPEMKTAGGEEARKALEKMLGIADGKTGVLVLIKTAKSDKYDRYLADIWVEGVYVNQELVDKGHAVIVEE